VAPSTRTVRGAACPPSSTRYTCVSRRSPWDTSSAARKQRSSTSSRPLVPGRSFGRKSPEAIAVWPTTTKRRTW